MAAGTLALAGVALGVSLFSLVLNLGVIRRLRAYASQPRPASSFVFESGPRPGAILPSFATTSTVGTAVSSKSFSTGDGYIAFVSASCEACKTQFPLLEKYAKALNIDPFRSLVIVADDPDGFSPYARDGRQFAQVVLEDERGSLIRAFDIRAFPTLLGVRDGRVTASAPLVETLYDTHQSAI